MFTIARIMSNARDHHIGWQVVSPSKVGGLRYHDAKKANHPGSLEEARILMQARADELNAEAERNRSRIS